MLFFGLRLCFLDVLWQAVRRISFLSHALLLDWLIDERRFTNIL
jgi:hypothetical protein